MTDVDVPADRDAVGPGSAAFATTAADVEFESEVPLGRSVRTASAWKAASTLSLRFANIAVMSIVARQISEEAFGVFAVVSTVYAVVSSIGELGLISCLLRHDLDPDEIAPTITTITWVFSLLLAAGMFFFARPLSAALGAEQAAASMRVMSIVVLLVGLFAVPSGQLARDFRQDRAFLAEIIGFLPANVVLIVMAVDGGGAMAFAWSRVIGQFAGGFTVWLMVHPKFRPGFNRGVLRLLLAFGLPLAGANLFNTVLMNADFALIGSLMGAVSLGVYTLAFNVSSWATRLLADMLNSVAVPAFSRIKHDPARLRAAMARAIQAVAVIAFPICAFSLSLSRELIVTLYGRKWHSAAPVLTILAFYGALSVICLLFANVISSGGRTRGLLVVQVAWLVALVPGMDIGVHLGGVVGAAWAHIVVICVVAVPAYVIMLRRGGFLDARATAAALVLPLLASLGCLLASWAAAGAVHGDLLRLLVGVLAGGVVYVLGVSPVVAPVLHRFLPAGVIAAVGAYSRRVDRVTGLISPREAREARS